MSQPLQSFSTNRYFVGTKIRMSTAITDAISGMPFDPTTVSIELKTPDGAVTDLSANIVHDGVGLYHVDYVVTVVGFNQYEWVGAGSGSFVDQGGFFVDAAF